MSLHDQIECDCVRNNRTSVRAGDQSLACRTVSTASAPIGRGRNISDSGFGQVDPRRPILRAEHDDQHRKRRLLIAFALAPDARNRCDRRSFQREAMLGLRMSLASEFEKCACGDEAPIAFVERRPSDRKLNTGPPRGRDGAKLKFIGTSSIPLPAARITGPMSLILMSSACGRSSSVCCIGMPSSSACISIRPSECTVHSRCTSRQCSADA